MSLHGLTLLNEDYAGHFENHMFWCVESTEALDGQAMAIDLVGRSKYGKTLILRDGTWDPEHVPRLRLYRICPGSERLPSASKTTAEFARWCMTEEERLGVPVLVAWAVEREHGFDPDDCWQATICQGTAVLLRVKERVKLDMLDSVAQAFNGGRRSSWFELPGKMEWYYADTDFFHASDLRDEDGDTQFHDLVDRLVLMHRKIGDVAPALVRFHGQRYEPALLNPATREGYRIEFHRNTLVMTYASFSTAGHIIGIGNPPIPDESKVESIHKVKAWRIQGEHELVMDVLIETAVRECRDAAWYRLDFKDLFERISTRATAEPLLVAVTEEAPAEIRKINEHRIFIREVADRYWSWKIFSTPWITRAGELMFLNRCSLVPYWIVKIGRRIEPG